MTKAATIVSFPSGNLLCDEYVWGLSGGNWTFDYMNDSCTLALPHDASFQAVAWLGNENGTKYDESYQFNFFTFESTSKFLDSHSDSVGLLFRIATPTSPIKSYLFSIHNNQAVIGIYNDGWSNVIRDYSFTFSNNEPYTLKVSNENTNSSTVYNFYINDTIVFSNIELTDYIDTGSFGIRAARACII